MTRYSKALAALAVSVVIAAVTAAAAVISDGMSAQDWTTVVLAALAPVAVYLAPRNDDPKE